MKSISYCNPLSNWEGRVLPVSHQKRINGKIVFRQEEEKKGPILQDSQEGNLIAHFR